MMDAYEQSTVDRFWHNIIKETFAKTSEKNIALDYGKYPNPVLIWGPEYICAFLTERK